MKPIIVQITGHAGHGKDTSADYLITNLTQQGLKVLKVSLADRLKLIDAKLIEYFYGVSIPIEEFYDNNKKELLRPELPLFKNDIFSLRSVLQLTGTDIFRQLLWPTIWCDLIYHEYISKNTMYDVIVIPDCRFPDEIKYFEELQNNGEVISCITCRVTRNNITNLSLKNQQHESEKHISKIKVDLEIQNDGTIESLYSKLDNTLIKMIAQTILKNDV